MRKVLAFLSLFTSFGTLLCCAIPALFVALGFGAAFAGFIGTFPQLIWVSEHKVWVFGTGAVFLLVGGLLQKGARECPSDPVLAAACAQTRDWSGSVYVFSVVLYLTGAVFAFLV